MLAECKASFYQLAGALEQTTGHVQVSAQCTMWSLCSVVSVQTWLQTVCRWRHTACWASRLCWLQFVRRCKIQEKGANSALIDLSLCCLNTYLKYVALFDQSCNHSNKSLHSCRDKLSICCFSPTTTSSGQDILNRQMHDMLDWAVFKLFNTVANALSTGTM